MKKSLTKIDPWNLFIGIVIGIGVGVCLFSFLVPSGLQMIRVYGLERYQNYKTGYFNVQRNMMVSNPYMMNTVNSEKEFLKEMILHHKAAISMAEQVLSLNPSKNIENLAKEIITTQSDEIKMMGSWLKPE